MQFFTRIHPIQSSRDTQATEWCIQYEWKKKVLESEFSKEKKDKHWLLTWSIIVEFEKAHMQKSVPQRNGSWGQMLSETFFVS